MTSTKSAFPKIDSSTTRKEEIAFLQSLVDHFSGSQSYLEVLFTQQLADKFAEKVADDFSFSPMAEIESMTKDIDMLTSERVGLRQLMVIKDQQINELKDQNARLNQMIDNVQNQLSHATAAKLQLEDELSNQYEADSEKIAQLKKEVTELKAKLYDLISNE